MCWGKLPRHPGRAHAWPLCGPWPRPHLAASKLVELRSSVNLVAMPHQPLDRHTPEPINPALRRVATQRSWNWAVLGSPRCGCRGESQRAGDTNPGLSWGRLLRRLAAATGTGSARKARSASGTKKLPRGDHRPHVSASWGDHFLMLTTKNPIRCQIPPQQGAAVGVVLSFGADLIPILNLDAALAVVPYASYCHHCGAELKPPLHK
jgi:hypothetical protein